MKRDTKSVLAIITPQIGFESETYIRRHIRDLFPRRVVISQSMTESQPSVKPWVTGCPTLLISPGALPKRTYLKTIDSEFGCHAVNLGRVRRFILEHRVTHILGEQMDFSHAWFLLAKQMGIRFFVHAHGRDVSSALRLDKWKRDYQDYNDAGAVFTVSRCSRENLLRIGIDKKIIRVIPCGVAVPSEIPRRSPARSDRIRCLAVGRMVAKKSPLLVLESFLKALKLVPGLRLDYVGAGPLLEEAKEYARKNDLNSRVRFLGARPNVAVLRMMRKSDLFIQHSSTDADTGDEEGLPVTILEALANGLPIVSTLHAGIPEAVIHGKSGLLSRSGDSSQMSRNIVAMACDLSLRRRMALNGWKRARRHFSWAFERSRLLSAMGLNK
jgi:colanic acid/amylovoran biosynthesis glycosyltransferase